MNFASYREEGPTSFSLWGFEGNDDGNDDVVMVMMEE